MNLKTNMHKSTTGIVGYIVQEAMGDRIEMHVIKQVIRTNNFLIKRLVI